MARPKKNGLDYFPLDVDIFEDEKIGAIAGEFGPKGELAVIKLLCAIYKKGYFILWNDLTQANLLKQLSGFSNELLNEIVNRLVGWGFFDKVLFNSMNVLTSANIQAVYFEAIKRRKTARPTKYLINVDNNSVNEDINSEAEGFNVDINPQSKVKESKVKQSKEKHTRENVDFHDSDFQEYLKQFIDFGGKSKARQNQSLQAWLKLIPEQREQALKGARNYIAWYKETGDKVRYLKNASVFLDEMLFVDFQEPVKAKKPSGKIVKPVPEWSEPEYKNTTTPEELEELKKLQIESLKRVGKDKGDKT